MDTRMRSSTTCQSLNKYILELKKIIKMAGASSKESLLSCGNNSFMINTRKLCIFCFKKSVPDSENGESLVTKILSRYFGVNLVIPELAKELESRGVRGSSIKNDCIQLPLCENCSALVFTMSQLYQQIEIIQMKLNAYGQNLCDIMASACKVQSRLMSFNKRFPKDQQSERIKCLIKSVRKEVTIKCSEWKLPRRLKDRLPSPKVVLERCDSVTSPKTPEPVDDDHDDDSEELYLAYVGCTISFWLVLLLATIDAENLSANSVSKESKLPLLPATVLLLPPNFQSIEIKTANTTNTCGDENNVKRSQPDVHGNGKRKAGAEETSLEPQTKKLKLSGSDFKNDIGEIRTKSGSESVSEENLVQREFQKAYEKISGRPLSTQKSETFSPPEMQLCTLITHEQAANAVQAIQIQTIVPFAEDVKTLRVKEESEVKLFVSSNTDSHASPMDINSPKGQILRNHGLSDLMISKHVIPPVTIDFVEVSGNKPSTSKASVEPKPTEQPKKLVHACHLCQELFDSRAKVEKHRVLEHNITHYVKCPVCSQMFLSHFHLEEHRTNMPNCQLDEREKKRELLEIARPFFPPERHIKGNNFCTYTNCHEVFEDITKLRIHLKTHGSFQCRFGCNQSFEKAHELAVHEIHIHNKKCLGRLSLKCPRCELVHEHVNDYLSHFIFQHLNISSFIDECHVCKRGFYTLTGSRSHFHMFHDIAGKDEKQIFRCNLCGGAFLRQAQLTEHREKIHSLHSRK